MVNNWNISVKTRKFLVPIIDTKKADNRYVPIIDDLRYVFIYVFMYVCVYMNVCSYVLTVLNVLL